MPKIISKKFPKRSLLPHKHIVPPQTNTIGWDIVMSSSNRVLCWFAPQRQWFGEVTLQRLTYSRLAGDEIQYRSMWSAQVGESRKPQCLLQCPVLNGKDCRWKLIIIQPLNGVHCLGKGGGNERGQLTDSSLSVSLHPSCVLKTAVSQAERFCQCGNSYSQPETREMDGVWRQDARWGKVKD